MNSNRRRGPLLDHLDALEAKCEKRDPTLKEIFDTFGPEGHYLLIAFLVVPFLQPIPLLGLSTPFGLLMAFIAGIAYFGKPPWLPKRWHNKTVSAKVVSKIAEGSERVFEKFQRFLHPRLDYLFHGPFRVVNSLLVVCNAVLLALPLPIPFSNAFPAWVIALQTIAHLEKDGLIIIISYIQALLCVTYFVLIARGVDLGVKSLGF